MCKSAKENNSDIKISHENIKDYADSFSLKEEYFHSEAEEIAYNILKEEINEHYIILPHVAFTDVFAINASDDITKELRACVSEYHFDFVIYDSKCFLPVLLIEINGGSHTQIYKRHIDTFKEKLFTDMKGVETELNLINIDLLDQLPDDELLKDRIRKTLHYTIGSRIRYRAYCTDCKKPLVYTRNKTTKEYFYLCPHCKDKNNSTKNQTFDKIEIPSLLKAKEL